MADTLDIPTLLPPEMVASLPPEQLPALALYLAGLQSAVAGRLYQMQPLSRREHAEQPSRLLTAKEVAARTRLSVDYLYRRADRLPFARRIGRAVRFDETGLERWLAGRRPR
ncbi:MAG TPA: helix-turn-helix domain-containing protein [Candidatus Binatia bacterium]|nr:helix-turn-helix domain-containing protein [Candidatus Binatia bacterium]